MTRSRIDFANPWQTEGPRLQLAFGAPHRVLTAQRPETVRAVLNEAEAAALAGAWVLGWLSYEAACGLNPSHAVHPPRAGLPLAWFAIHDGPVLHNARTADSGGASAHWHTLAARAAFDRQWSKIQNDFAADRYHGINLTTTLHGQLQSGDAAALFAALQRAQPGGYAAHLNCGNGLQLLSVSPELYFDWQRAADGSGAILTRPMKGTAPRGGSPAEDQAWARQLQQSPKERQENALAAELLAQELGALAKPGSVHQPRRFQLQALPSVWQMSSDVQAQTRSGTRLADVFAALFPCASVTGSPKQAAMQAIRELEPSPRGVYCGALGLLWPEGEPGAYRARFNVPIRTIELQDRQLRCGIGSGITAQARADDEWREWQAKQIFLDRASTPFELIETLALKNGQLQHGPEHLARLARSAAHFNFRWNEAAVYAALQTQQRLHPEGNWRLRLLLNAQGQIRAETQAMAAAPATPVRLALAGQALRDVARDWLAHKTTRRSHYRALAPQADSGIFDTLLYNAAGELTETTFGNIAACIDGRWLTPALHCGLLPGVGREIALREGRLQEAVLRLPDIPRVQAWAFINSLRGWLPARLEPPSPVLNHKNQT